jgi:DNA adenine methylase
MRLDSPLRYPGGKASLATILNGIINANGLRGCPYYEPYAGGAGAALGLLMSGTVSKIYLNDADPRIFAFWHTILNDTERFVDKILTTSLSIDQWHIEKQISDSPSRHSRFDVAFATFFMNRCNRSGVISGAGPIGGYSQNGKWRLSVRFNREQLAERVLKIVRMKNQICVYNDDGVEFLKKTLPQGRARARAFVFADPPYVRKSRKLYMGFSDPKLHGYLARYLKSQKSLPWVVTYDDDQLVRDLYSYGNLTKIDVLYSLQKKRIANELLITPRRLSLPYATRSTTLELGL